jgi:hypothetical protein
VGGLIEGYANGLLEVYGIYVRREGGQMTGAVAVEARASAKAARGWGGDPTNRACIPPGGILCLAISWQSPYDGLRSGTGQA